MIYLDNAATTKMKPQSVVDAVASSLTSFGNSGRSANDSAMDASRVIFETRQKIATFVHLNKPENVIFTCNSTEALNIAIQGTLSKDDHVIITMLEHNSVLRPVYALCQYSFLPVDDYGQLQYRQLESLLMPNTKAIICNHISNVTGNIANLHILGEFAQKHQLLFIVDASQSLGEYEVNMSKDYIDILCFTGHKSLFGPQGTGGLCIRPGIEIKPLKMGGTGVQTYLKNQPPQYPTRLEAGTLNGHGIAGLNAALDFIQDIGIKSIVSHNQKLIMKLYQGIRGMDSIQILGNFDEEEHGPILSFYVPGFDSGRISEILMEEYHIATRSGALCAPIAIERLGAKETGVVRLSISYFNTEEEIESVICALKEILA